MMKSLSIVAWVREASIPSLACALAWRPSQARVGRRSVARRNLETQLNARARDAVRQ